MQNFQQLPSTKDYLTPCIDSSGAWGTISGIAIKESLSRGSLEGVMDILNPMDGHETFAILSEAGFLLNPTLEAQSKTAIFSEIQTDLTEALKLHVDGFGLRESRLTPSVTFAAKEQKNSSLQNPDAATEIQHLLKSEYVTINLSGIVPAHQRGALLFIAGQALETGVQGFGFEGIKGKYEVALTMPEVVNLHGEAAQHVAEESVYDELKSWSAGGKVNQICAWVPDSIQRLLYGSLSVPTVNAVVSAIDGGLISNHAREFGLHRYTNLLAEQGFDVNAPTVVHQAEELGLTVIDPDTNRGLYVGSMVGEDHRCALIKFARDKAILLPFTQDQMRPKLGDTVRVKFAANELTLTISEREKQNHLSR